MGEKKKCAYVRADIEREKNERKNDLERVHGVRKSEREVHKQRGADSRSGGWRHGSIVNGDVWLGVRGVGGGA